MGALFETRSLRKYSQNENKIATNLQA